MELIINSPTHGTHTILYDKEDHALISKYKWFIQKSGKRFYAKTVTGRKGKPITMHSLIMGRGWIDHISWDGRDNRRRNLRYATVKQNNYNRNSVGNVNGFRGLSCPTPDLYKVTVKLERKNINGGSFTNKYEAALVYNELAQKYFGEFAVLNKLTKKELQLAKRIVRVKKRIDNKSGYIGISCAGEKFMAYISNKNQRLYLGTFDTALEAAKVRDLEIIKRGFPLKRLNFPDEFTTD
jgi:hypothetical protein